MARKLTVQDKEEKQRKKQAVEETNARIFNLLFVEDELSWKDIIYKLIEDEHMDPWDIDVSILAQKFLEMLQKLKELDFRISGKMVLASAILLKMKSDILIDEDIANFDEMMNATEENLSMDDALQPIVSITDGPAMYPKTPQPRQRKVSVYDLVNALEKALAVEVKRNKNRVEPKKIDVHSLAKNHFDLGKSMVTVYSKIESHYNNKKTKDSILTFDDLVMSDSKRDKVLTFVPLLHLDTQRKVDLDQQKHFETISVKLVNRNPVESVDKPSEEPK